MKKNIIGVLDSGVGGISLLIELVKKMSNQKFIYFGDNKNAPYGNKNRSELLELAFNDITYLKSFGVSAIVVACNTLSVNALPLIKHYIDIPVYGVYPPVERCLIESKKTLLLATTSTANYYKNIYNKDKYEHLTIYGCKTLVSNIEKNICNLDSIDLTREIPYTCKDGFERVILGCTHYYFVKNKILDHLKPQAILGGNEYSVGRVIKDMCFSDEIHFRKENTIDFVGKDFKKNKLFYNLVVKDSKK